MINGENKIAIDTCVFLHLLNPTNNPDSHIDQLLAHLAKSKARLQVDEHGKIAAEYIEKIVPCVQNADDIGIERVILKYWMFQAPRDEVSIELGGQILSRLKQIIFPKDETVDRMFVAVAATAKCDLITNDNIHILPNRTKLRQRTKDWHAGQMQILNSVEARDSYTVKKIK